ncbi:hypothetical protein PR048_010940 [Dryococelus australis]|uniref:Uncharacterized protein n=1 Tax=Dryococelus australis TaxID=614101 RepID=A0ABQ9HK98_9NEOP|nr:hypothetical protein PR048_010940 [Dryococelus australis]
MQGRGKRAISEKIRRPAASSCTIPTYENPGDNPELFLHVNTPGIELIEPNIRCRLTLLSYLWLDYSPPTLAKRLRFPTVVAPGFSHVGIVPDDDADRRVFSGVSCFTRFSRPR